MKTYAILVSLILLGLLLSLCCTVIPKDHWVSLWLMQLAAVFVIGGGLGVIDKTFLHRDHFKQIRSLFNIHESCTDLGLEQIVIDSSRYSYASMIRDESVLRLVFNDGRSWISSRISDFQYRFEHENYLTELFVPDPEKDYVRVLAEKTGYSEGEQREKIQQAKRRLIEEYKSKGCKGTLKIYHIPFFPTHSVFLSSNIALITLYGISSGRRAVPLICYRKTAGKNSLFSDVVDDIEKLRKESICAFDSSTD